MPHLHDAEPSTCLLIPTARGRCSIFFNPVARHGDPMSGAIGWYHMAEGAAVHGPHPSRSAAAADARSRYGA